MNAQLSEMEGAADRATSSMHELDEAKRLMTARLADHEVRYRELSDAVAEATAAAAEHECSSSEALARLVADHKAELSAVHAAHASTCVAMGHELATMDGELAKSDRALQVALKALEEAAGADALLAGGACFRPIDLDGALTLSLIHI